MMTGCRLSATAQGRPAHASLGYRTPAEPFADELPDLQA